MNTLTHIRTTVSAKGRVVIPASMREALDLKPGTVIDISLVDDEVRISTFRSRLERAQRRVRQYSSPGKLGSDELIAQRREEARKEEAEYTKKLKPAAPQKSKPAKLLQKRNG